MEPIQLFIRKNQHGRYDAIMRGGMCEMDLVSNAVTPGDAIIELGTRLQSAFNAPIVPAPVDPDGLADTLATQTAYIADAVERIGTLEQELALLKGESPDGHHEGHDPGNLHVSPPNRGAGDPLHEAARVGPVLRGGGARLQPPVSRTHAGAPQNPGGDHVGERGDRAEPVAGDADPGGRPAPEPAPGPIHTSGNVRTQRGHVISGGPIRGPFSEG